MSEQIDLRRRRFLGTAVAAASFGAIGSARAQSSKSREVEGELPSLGGATGWLNSPPLTAAHLRGKGVLVDFWTYTCINWLRQFPHVRAWAEKYKELVVVGVHSPEFRIEKDLDNVRNAVKDRDIGFPVAIDSDFAIWHAFDNQYWPALYVIDGQGRIRHHQFGQGGYEKTERSIQQLVGEAGGAGDRLAPVDARGIEAEAAWDDLKSPENYLGKD